MADTNLLTASQIADQFGEAPQRVTYIIHKYRLKPVERVVIIRLFSQEQAKAIKQALYNIQVRSDRR